MAEVLGSTAAPAIPNTMQIKQLLDSFNGAELRAFREDLEGWTREKIRQFDGSDQAARVALFVVWSKQHLRDADLIAWIEALPEEAQAVLTEHLAHFCADFDMELEWILDPRCTVDEALREGVRAVAENYCRACQVAIACHDEARRYKRHLYLQRMQKRR